MGPVGAQINKALLPIDDRAILTHIIEKFPSGARFVIALGYLGNQVRDYLDIAHAEKSFTYVEVENFDGSGSGPGHSLLCCKHHLQHPFYFVSCDTLWEGAAPPGNANWLGVDAVAPEQTSSYCMVKVEGAVVTDLKDKEQIRDDAYKAFVGLCFIQDFGLFWKAFEIGEIVAGERQVSNGIKLLVRESVVSAVPINWTDVGDFQKYKRAVERFSDYDFSKSDEFFYRVGPKVIKYFVDSRVTDRRVEKASLNANAFPAITDHKGGFYAYAFQPGETLYERNSPATLRNLLAWLESVLWNEVPVTGDVMRKACRSFYHDKTLQRLETYDRKYLGRSNPVVINGATLPPFRDLLERIPWARIEQGLPAFIHGDLQFDNIIFDQDTGRFTLLDWRHDFAGHVGFGDLYYDLAKLRGGIILNYDLIKRNLLSYEETGEYATFDFARREEMQEYLDIVDRYIEHRGMDLARVRLLVALIYLNMAPLHHYPFDKMLHALGHQQLANEIGVLS